MPNKQIDSTIQIARKLVDHLPKKMAYELKLLIQRAEEGQNTTIEVIELLSPHENIRLWMQEQIASQDELRGDSSTRGYGSLPGAAGSISASKRWVCPRGACNESLPVIQEGEDAPSCGVHAITMIRSDRKG